MDGAAGVEAVGVRGDAAHRVHRHGAPEHRVVLATVRVGPCDRQLDRFFECRVRKFGREASDRFRVHATAFADVLRCVLVGEEPFGNQLECRYRLAAIGQRVFARDQWRDVGQCRIHSPVRATLLAVIPA